MLKIHFLGGLRWPDFSEKEASPDNTGGLHIYLIEHFNIEAMTTNMVHSSESMARWSEKNGTRKGAWYAGG